MALATTPVIKAAVAHIMQVKEGDYGPYQSVLFEGEGLPDGKLWRALNPGEAQQLCKGQAVELTPTRTKSGKASWSIRPLSAPAQPQPTVPQMRSPQAQPVQTAERSSQAQAQSAIKQKPAKPPAEDRKQQIAAYINSMGDLYAHCLQVAQAKIGSDNDSETVRCMASSLYISADRRFGLTRS